MTATVCLRERPIVFSAAMVRALLEGRKTQTRRVVKPQPHRDHGLKPMWGTSPDGVAHGENWLWREVGADYPDDDTDDRRSPYGQPGDRLWVKEAVERGHIWRGYVPATDGVYYRADGQLATDAAWAWKRDTLPSMFCPRGLSRITLELTGIGVERVQDITDAEALAEGVRQLSKDAGRTWKFGIGEPGDRGAWAWSRFLPTARLAFSSLWDELNEARGHGWDANPWVWVLEFRRVAS